MIELDTQSTTRTTEIPAVVASEWIPVEYEITPDHELRVRDNSGTHLALGHSRVSVHIPSVSRGAAGYKGKMPDPQADTFFTDAQASLVPRHLFDRLTRDMRTYQQMASAESDPGKWKEGEVERIYRSRINCAQDVLTAYLLYHDPAYHA